MAGRRPLIAVTGADSRFPIAWWATRFQLWLAGGRARRLTPSMPPEVWHERYDGVIIGGGSDVDPKLYGGDEVAAHRLNLARDRFEVEIIRRALTKPLPILGICRGAQLINVVLGGTLYRDIRGLRRRTTNRYSFLPVKTAIATIHGRLFGMVQRLSWRINSLHRQAVKQPGKDVVVAARDLDDIVQAIELEGPHYVVGVQWHPEYLPYLAPQRRVFRALVHEARKTRPDDLEHRVAGGMRA